MTAPASAATSVEEFSKESVPEGGGRGSRRAVLHRVTAGIGPPGSPGRSRSAGASPSRGDAGTDSKRSARVFRQDRGGSPPPNPPPQRGRASSSPRRGGLRFVPSPFVGEGQGGGANSTLTQATHSESPRRARRRWHPPARPVEGGVMRRRMRIGFILAALATIGCGAWRGFREWRTAGLLAAGRAAMARGDFAAARVQFAGVLAYRPGDDEAAYRLGLCEQERGQRRRRGEGLGAGSAPPRRSRGWPRYGSPRLRSSAAGTPAPRTCSGGRSPAYDRSRRRPARCSRGSCDSRTAATRRGSSCGRNLRLASAPVRAIRDLWLLDFEAVPVNGPAPCSNRRPATPPTTTASGWGWRTSPPGRPVSTTPRRGSRRASPPGPTTPADLACVAHCGPATPAGPMRPAVPWLTSPPAGSPRPRSAVARLARPPCLRPRRRAPGARALVELDPAPPAALDRLAELDIHDGRSDRAADPD